MGTHDASIYENLEIHFVTQHDKQRILAPLFAELGIKCRAVEIDTDQYGTFSGEIERSGTVRETLRKKIDAGRSLLQGERLFLASEGSFGPHPTLGVLQTDLEALLLFDAELGIEIYAEFLCLHPVHAEMSFGPVDNFRAFLARVGLPDHGVIVRPENRFSPVFKGLHTEREVGRAMFESFLASPNGRVLLTTDLRANHNRTRRNAILRAGERLIEKIRSRCPSCGSPGFSVSAGIPGLPCAECAEPSAISKALVWSCVKCTYSETRARLDGATSASASECQFCNP